MLLVVIVFTVGVVLIGSDNSELVEDSPGQFG